MVIVDSNAIVHNRHAAASKLESGDSGGGAMENSSTGGASFLLASYPPVPSCSQFGAHDAR